MSAPKISVTITLAVTAAVFAFANGAAATGKPRPAHPPVIRSLFPDKVYLLEGTSNPEQLPTIYNFTIHGSGFRRRDIVRCDDVAMPKQLSVKFKSSHELIVSININTVTKDQRFFYGAEVPVTVYDPIRKATSNAETIKIYYHPLGG